jgi:hypothetical protein
MFSYTRVKCRLRGSAALAFFVAVGAARDELLIVGMIAQGRRGFDEEIVRVAVGQRRTFVAEGHVNCLLVESAMAPAGAVAPAVGVTFSCVAKKK